jgi:hypothetical protein
MIPSGIIFPQINLLGVLLTQRGVGARRGNLAEGQFDLLKGLDKENFLPLIFSINGSHQAISLIFQCFSNLSFPFQLDDSCMIFFAFWRGVNASRIFYVVELQLPMYFMRRVDFCLKCSLF